MFGDLSCALLRLCHDSTEGLSGLMPAKHLPASLFLTLRKDADSQKRSIQGVYEGLKGRELEDVYVCVCESVHIYVFVTADLCLCVHCIELCVFELGCMCVCLSAQCRWVAEWLLQPNDSVC